MSHTVTQRLPSDADIAELTLLLNSLEYARAYAQRIYPYLLERFPNSIEQGHLARLHTKLMTIPNEEWAAYRKQLRADSLPGLDVRDLVEYDFPAAAMALGGGFLAVKAVAHLGISHELALSTQLQVLYDLDAEVATEYVKAYYQGHVEPFVPGRVHTIPKDGTQQRILKMAAGIAELGLSGQLARTAMQCARVGEVSHILTVVSRLPSNRVEVYLNLVADGMFETLAELHRLEELAGLLEA